MTNKTLFLILCLVLFLAGCGNGAAATTAPPPTDPAPASATVAPPTPTIAPPTPTDLPPSATPKPALLPLPPEAQRIEFKAEDGAALVGYYYPAAVNPAPLIVLMHWAGGDQTDWLYVGMVAWLQNRGAQIPTSPETKYFDTPYPFQPLPENLSFAVFTFDFRGYGESAGSGGQDKLILDARAAYATAAGLEAVDSARVAGIGASIGADGVVDGCETCIGALSLSPGNWLGMAYPQAVQALDDDGKPVWCVAAEDDEPAIKACNAASGEHYQQQIYPAGGHAMVFFRAESNLQPLIETVILDFLKDTLGPP